MKRIFADFNNMSAFGAVRLDCKQSIKDIGQKDIRLGECVVVTDGEMEGKAVLFLDGTMWMARLTEKLQEVGKGQSKAELALSRLEELFQKKERECEELEERLDRCWDWREVFDISEEKNYGLPVPRLEIRTFPDGDRRKIGLYSLVLEFYGISHPIQAYPLSTTSESGGGRHNNEIFDPHRDGVHIRHDGTNLNLPCFLVHDVTGQVVDLKDDMKVYKRGSWRNKL